MNDNDDSDIDVAIKRLAGEVVKEVNNIECDKTQYTTRLHRETIEDCVSDTLMRFLSKLSNKLNGTQQAYLIGNIVTSALRNYPTPLQIALAVLMRNSKALVSNMNELGVTCTYDELLRFKKSAAVAASSSPTLQGISDSNSGLIQVVVDNFDADISSQNGKLSTHSLAVLVTQPDVSNQTEHSDNTEVITRVKRNDMSKPIDYEINIERYTGPSKPKMPTHAARKTVMPLKVLAEMTIVGSRAKEMDFSFLKTLSNDDNCPEFNGYNTKICRDQGHSPKSKTKAMYLPLIDMTPSDPDTIVRALRQAQQITTECGQEYVVFTADLQLYRVAVNVLWAYPEQFDKVVLRLGGMHTLMSFIGSVGSLMAGSGLYELLESTFAGVQKMMTGKKFPQNVRALRIVAEELLRPILTTDTINDANDLQNVLDDISSRSRTAHLWIDCVIQAVFIMMLYIRAEREADWCLHLTAVREMLPYFFAAGHVNYARYGLYYLRTMEAMPQACQEQFLKGEHVMRHVPGVWNGIWSDMFIETTFMRYGHGKRGIIGVTLKPETLKIWSLSLHICSRLEQDLSSFINPDDDSELTGHKEELKGRINSDKADRESIRKKLQECIDPLNPEIHPPEIVNIAIGKIAQDTVNVDKAVELGAKQMKDFENGWPNNFNNKLSRVVKTQAESRKYIKIGDAKVFDTELIYSRVIGIQASSRDIDIKQLLSYELSPVPTAMFSESGDMRVAKSKSVLKKALQKEVSARCVKKQISTAVIDGSAILYVIPWPKSNATVGDFVIQFRNYIEKQLQSYDVYLVFDRYRDYSTKGVTRDSQGAYLSRVHQLTTVMPIPLQKVVLSIPENKRQLIGLIVDDLCSNTVFPETTTIRKLVVTGEDPVPVELTSAVTIKREDLRTNHKEADNILAHQMVAVASEGNKGVSVISDDTDVFALLLHFYVKHKLTGVVIMESPVKDRITIDIRATANDNKHIIPDLLTAHALSGCDTTACYFGIGKGTVVKTLKTQNSPLTLLGDSDASFEDALKQSTDFIASCYSVTGELTTMLAVRQKVWSSCVGKAPSCGPKLHSLPPTTESFTENVKRAHLQTSVWKQATEIDPPKMDPVDYGWEKNEATKSLVPVMLPKDVKLAPPEVLQLIKCSCGSETPCGTLRCRCNSARLSCTIFCACQGSVICSNGQTKHT